jgi:hypothetical protein
MIPVALKILALGVGGLILDLGYWIQNRLPITEHPHFQSLN